MYTTALFLLVLELTFVQFHTEHSKRYSGIIGKNNASSTKLHSKHFHCPGVPKCRCRQGKADGTFIVQCVRKNYTDVPTNLPTNVSVLNVSMNKITKLHNFTFTNLRMLRMLDLSHNEIDYVDAKAFDKSENIVWLRLSSNKIRYIDPFNSALKNLVSVEYLSIEQRLNELDSSESFPMDAVSSMKNLTELYCDAFPVSGFQMPMEQLNTLAHRQIHSASRRCNISILTNATFVTVPNLKSLTLKNCSISNIENGAFSYLTKLESLSLASNDQMGFKVLRNLSFDIANTSLTDLDLSGVHEVFGECIKLRKYDVEYLKYSNLTNLNLNSNRLSYVDEDAVDFIPRNLHDLHLQDNILLMGSYIVKLFIDRVFRNMRTLDLSYQRLNHDYTRVIRAHEAFLTYKIAYQESLVKQGVNMSGQRDCTNCDPFHPKFIRIALPYHLKEVKMDATKIETELSTLCFCEPNDLNRLSISNNKYYSIQGRFPGLSKLTHLNISMNSCENISQDVFQDMSNLRHLDASHNFLGFPLAKDMKGVIFSPLSRLCYLNLRNNKIRTLPTNLFRGLVSILKIDLAENLILKLDVNFKNLQMLRYLNLGGNFLHSLNEEVRSAFDDQSSHKSFIVDLSNNFLKCDCDRAKFVTWIANTKVKFLKFDTYTCKLENGSTSYLKYATDLENSLDSICSSYTGMIIAVSVCLALMISILGAGIFYRYRWDLRYLFYSAKLRMKGYVPLDANGGHVYDVDAFVSYSDHNREFVINELINELEELRGVRLCIHERDFQPGSSVMENMIKAITTSKKTLIVLSQHFVDSSWCIYETNIARMEAIKTGRDVLCVVKLEDVDVSKLSLEVLDILRNQTYIEVPKDPDHMTGFWERLKSSILT